MSSTSTGTSSPSRNVVQYRHICPTCGRAFQRATGLERHRRSAHSKEKTYACEFCSQAYSRIDLLQRHVSLYHKRAATDKGRMQENVALAMAQQPAMQQNPQLSTMTHTPQSLQLPLPQFHPPHAGFDNLMSSPPIVQQQQQFLVNHDDQDLLNWFNGIIPDEPMMQDGTHGNGVPMTHALSSSLPWASSNFSEPLQSMYFGGGGSGPNTAPGSVITPTTLSPGIEPFSSSSLGDVSTDTALSFLSPPQSVSLSSASMDLSSISDADIWPSPMASHLEAYQNHFAHHMPFIHPHSLLYAKSVDELECDLRRAVAMVGGNYESLSMSLQQSDMNGGGVASTIKPCDYYGCASLKAKTVRCIESIPEQPLGGSDSLIQLLLRRTQTMILLQMVAMFSEVKTHRVSAKLTHGALVAIARELLEHVSFAEHGGSWVDWIRREEIIRTLWSVYIVDSLQSFCYRRRPGLSLSELSHLPDLGADELWLATTEAEFHKRFAQSTAKRESIFEFMLSLNDGAHPTPPGCLSPSGQLLIVITLVSEIMSTMQADTVARRQLASRLERVLSNPQTERSESLRALAQALDRGDTQLRQQVDSNSRQLSRWLSLLQHSTSCSYLQGKGLTPFIRDFMPWYWAGMHLLGVLRARPALGTTSPDQLGERLASCSALTQGSTNVPDDASIEIMHLLVRIRLSLSVLDGGAKMQSAIGSAQFTSALPALPDYLATISIAGLFPPLLYG